MNTYSHALALELARMHAVRAIRVVHAVIAVTRRHVPAWLGVLLTVCLFIPGPVDELLVLLVIAGMVAFKPAMRSDMVTTVRAVVA